MGATSLAVDTGSLTPYSSLDYNGYFGVAREGALFRWNDGKRATPYSSLAAFSDATGHEKHGLMVNFSIFENAPLPVRGATTAPQQYDLGLRAGSIALDAGLPLPNINDDFTGAGADLGAYERGRALPHYGPRSISRAVNFTATVAGASKTLPAN